MLHTRPKMVTSEEVEEVGGLRPLNNKERTNISKMFQISEDEITTLPLIRIVADKDVPLPDFDKVLKTIIKNAPNPHVNSVFEHYFKTSDPNAGVAKGIVEWEDKMFPEELTLSVYYRYQWDKRGSLTWA